MRQHNNKNNNNRSRGRGGRKGPNPLTRSYESNGPDVKVRGTAQHVAEKYQTLARDSLAAGDGISAEAYFQYAEHYNRIIMTAQAQQNTAREEERRHAAQAQAQVNVEQSAEAAAPVTGDEPQPAVVDATADNQPRNAQPSEEKPKSRRPRSQNRQPRRNAAKAEAADAPVKADTADSTEPASKGKSDTIMDNPPAFLMTD